MNQRLSGERIALFESRLAAEISELVRRTGAVPICVPAVREELGDGHACPLFDHGVQVSMRRLEPLRDQLAHRGLPAAHETEERQGPSLRSRQPAKGADFRAPGRGHLARDSSMM